MRLARAALVTPAPQVCGVGSEPKWPPMATIRDPWTRRSSTARMRRSSPPSFNDTARPSASGSIVASGPAGGYGRSLDHHPDGSRTLRRRSPHRDESSPMSVGHAVIPSSDASTARGDHGRVPRRLRAPRLCAAARRCRRRPRRSLRQQRLARLGSLVGRRAGRARHHVGGRWRARHRWPSRWAQSRLPHHEPARVEALGTGRLAWRRPRFRLPPSTFEVGTDARNPGLDPSGAPLSRH